MKALIILTQLILLTSCFVSKEEMAARQDNAFDLSGTWSQQASNFDGTFTITNQGTKDDIYITLNSPEIKKVLENIYYEYKILGLKTRFINKAPRLGYAHNVFQALNPDNKSTDFGKTSKIWISESASNVRYRFCISFSSATNDDDKNLINGSIKLTVYETIAGDLTNDDPNDDSRSEKVFGRNFSVIAVR